MKKYIVVICWSFSVLAALFVGQSLKQPADYSFHTEENKSPVHPGQEAAAELSIAEQQESKTKTLAPMPVYEAAVKRQPKPAGIHSLISDLETHFGQAQYNNFDNYQNMADTWEKIKTLDEEQLYEMYSQLEANNEKGVNWNIAKILYARMGELDPGRAIAFAVSKKQGYAVQGVIHSWSKDKPFEALQWIQNNKDSFSTSSNIDYYSLFNNVAKVDAAKAFESLKEFDQSKQRSALKGILKSLETNEDFLKVITQIDELENKRENISSALYYWGQKSPKDALAFAQTLETEQERKDAERKVESAWVRSNPEEAASWIIENNDNKKNAVTNIINNWDWRQGEKLFGWIQKQNDPSLKDDANLLLVNRYSYNDTDISRKALEQIESEEIRKKAVAQIYRSLRYRNQKAAAEFLNGRSEIPEEEKEKLLSSKTNYRY